MLKHRVIPVLLLSDDRLVKTHQFKEPKYIGDPLNAIRIFNEKEVDELIVLDINASRTGAEPNYKTIEKLASECFMPLCYGGGVRSAEQAAKIFALGVEKVSVQTAALNELAVISAIANRFGSQAVAVSVDIKSDWFGRRRLLQSCNGKFNKQPWREFLNSVVAAGAGEIILNSVNRDGTLLGPDLELISQANDGLAVPLVALGGIGSMADIKAAVDAGASAVAAGAFFVFQGPHRAVLITYPKYSELEALFSENKI